MLTGSIRLSNRRLDQLLGGAGQLSSFSLRLGSSRLTNMISQSFEFIMIGKVNDDSTATLISLSQIHFRPQHTAKRLS